MASDINNNTENMNNTNDNNTNGSLASHIQTLIGEGVTNGTAMGALASGDMMGQDAPSAFITPSKMLATKMDKVLWPGAYKAALSSFGGCVADFNHILPSGRGYMFSAVAVLALFNRARNMDAPTVAPNYGTPAHFAAVLELDDGWSSLQCPVSLPAPIVEALRTMGGGKRGGSKALRALIMAGLEHDNNAARNTLWALIHGEAHPSLREDTSPQDNSEDDSAE